MAVAKAQITIPFFTNIPTDVITNTLHFANPIASMQTIADEITPEIQDFYEAIYGGSFGIAAYCSPLLATVSWYDLADPPPRVPYTLPMPITAAVETATSIPTEVATVLSFQADPESGIPQARRRNRIYIGGLTPNHVSTATGDNFPTIGTTFRAALGDAALLNFITNLSGSDTVWVARSETANTTVPVTNGWVDNSPDTQRRRSVEATARTLWPA
jgi:hypothetical protein